MVMYAQSSLEAFDPLGGQTNGFHLYSASVTSSYASNAYASGLIGIVQNGADTPYTMVQGLVAVGAVRRGLKSNVSVSYSPSYMKSFRGTSYNSLNHSVDASASRTLSSKWTLAASVNGMVNDFEQLAFAPTRFGDIAWIGSTFDELVAAMLTGQSTNVALTEAVNAAAIVGSPESAYLYGNRLLSAAANVSLSYAPSSRSSFGLSLYGGRTQYQPAENTSSSVRNRSSFRRSTNGSINFGWSYSLTPRTTVNMGVSSARTVSIFQDAYTSQANLSVGRILSRRWFTQGTVGAGRISPRRSVSSLSRNVQPQFGGTIGYKLYSQTFVASYDRSVSDAYGLGANYSNTSGGGWTWKRPGRGIATSAGFGYSRLIGPNFLKITSWSTQASVSRVLSNHLVMTCGFNYAPVSEVDIGNQ